MKLLGWISNRLRIKQSWTAVKIFMFRRAKFCPLTVLIIWFGKLIIVWAMSGILYIPLERNYWKTARKAGDDVIQQVSSSNGLIETVDLAEHSFADQAAENNNDIAARSAKEVIPVMYTSFLIQHHTTQKLLLPVQYLCLHWEIWVISHKITVFMKPWIILKRRM